MNAIKALLKEAPTIHPEAPKPLEISHSTAPPFPVDAFPERLRKGVLAIHEKSRAPLALCGQSVLAACALIAQGHVNVETLNGQVKPCSLFLLTIGGSGERKSTVDAMALAPIRTYEERLRENYQREYASYAVEKKAYDASVKAIERKQGLTYGNSEKQGGVTRFRDKYESGA